MQDYMTKYKISNTNQHHWRVLFFACLCLSSMCKNDPEIALRRQIRQLAKDGSISTDDCAALQVTAGATIDLATLQAIIREITHNETIPIECIDSSSMTPQTKKALNWKVYVENSGSMYGYMNADSDFKKCLYDLLTRFNGEGESSDLKIINNKVYDIDSIAQTPANLGISERLETLTDFLQQSKLSQLGDVRSSRLNEILRSVTGSLASGQPVVLVSDYVYSLHGKKDMKDELAEEKYTTKAVFQALRTDYYIAVIKGNSQFIGNYYAFDNSKSRIEEKRPFYLWVIGKKEDLSDFVEKYHINNLPGYEHHLVMGIPSEGKPYFSALNHTGKKGKFRPAEQGADEVKHLTSIEVDRRNGGFGFSVAMDLSTCKMSDEYLIDTSHYEVNSSTGDKFTLVAASKITEAEKNDRRLFGSATHFVTLEAQEVTADPQRLNIRLLNKLPGWVYESSTADDRTDVGRRDKTFGFSYLIEGVFEGLYGNEEKPAFYTFTLNLNK